VATCAIWADQRKKTCNGWERLFMGKNSSIEWTHHTFNPWWGCDKVSPACKNCYAEAWAKRVGENVWGEKAPRRFFGENHWRQPVLWNRLAQEAQSRTRVFCASMADVFEERADLDPAREKLWELVHQTPWLDWLLLTKRPHAVAKMVPWRSGWPPNVWLGTTVENQRWATKRIPHLLANGAKRRFLSCEPLLGPVDLTYFPIVGELHWVITGGESGALARPTHPDWFRSLRNQCRDKGVRFHFKQWGNWVPLEQRPELQRRAVRTVGVNGSAVNMTRLSKKEAGRALDNQYWDEVPSSVGIDLG
jgi:protein gp37